MSNFQVCNVINRPDGIGRGATGGAEEFGRDHGDVPVHTGNACPIPAFSSDGTGHVCAVVIVCGGIKNRVVIIGEVPAVNVVDKAIAVVVDTVDRVIGVGPDVVGNVWVRDLDTCVDNPDKDRFGARLSVIPGGFGIDAVGVGSSGRANGRWAVAAFHAPELTTCVVRIVADGRGCHVIVWFGKNNAGLTFVPGQSLLARYARRQFDQLHRPVAHVQALRSKNLVLELHVQVISIQGPLLNIGVH